MTQGHAVRERGEGGAQAGEFEGSCVGSPTRQLPHAGTSHLQQGRGWPGAPAERDSLCRKGGSGAQRCGIQVRLLSQVSHRELVRSTLSDLEWTSFFGCMGLFNVVLRT